MRRILYGVSPIGLGHATRASAVAELLRAGGAEVLFATGGSAAAFLRDCGYAVRDVVREPVPAVSGGEMKRAAVWYLRYWWGYRGTKRRLARVIGEYRPSLVVGDEEFASVSLALEGRTANALFTDELELGFARTRWARALERRAASWYSGLLSEAQVVIIPESGGDVGNRRYVGPVVRRVTKGRAEVREEYGLPASGAMVLLSLSGTGLGHHLLKGTLEAAGRVAGAYVVVTGNRSEKVLSKGVYDLGVVSDNQNLVAAADVVVSAAGKSTIDEAASAGTPMVAIPVKNHAEQERNGAALGYSPEDLHRLAEVIPQKIGRRDEPGNFGGAGKAADLLLSLT